MFVPMSFIGTSLHRVVEMPIEELRPTATGREIGHVDHRAGEHVNLLLASLHNAFWWRRNSSQSVFTLDKVERFALGVCD